MKKIKKTGINFFQLLMKVVKNSHGIFSFTRPSYNAEMARYYHEFFSKKGSSSFRTDKQNLRSDMKAIRADFNRAFRAYKKCV